MSIIYGRRDYRPTPKADLLPWERLDKYDYREALPMALYWKDVRDHRGDSWAWWANETHVLADPFRVPWYGVAIDRGAITEDPATWRGTHVVWIGK